MALLNTWFRCFGQRLGCKRWLWWAVFCSLLWTTQTQAATPSSPSAQPAANLDQVKLLFRQGHTLFVQRQFAESLGPLRRSFDMLGQLIQQAKTDDEKKQYQKYQRAFFATLAIAYHWNKEYVKSYLFYQRCIDAKPSQKLEELCRLNLPKVLQFLARLEIETVPKQSLLSIRGKGEPEKQPAPYQQWVSPGDVEVKIEADGYMTLQRRLAIQPGTRARFLFHLQKPSCPEEAAKPVAASAGDRLAVGSLGTTPSLAAGLPPAPQSIPQPFSAPLAGWQIGLIVAGATAGAALIGLGSFGIYTAVTSRDKFVIR